MSDYFDQHKAKLQEFNLKFRKRTPLENRIEIPEDLFRQCAQCKELILHEELRRNHMVCPHCDHYFILSARERIQSLVDFARFDEIDATLESKNPLEFPGYETKLQANMEKCNELEAFIGGFGEIQGIKVAIGSLDSRFFMGSMGSAVGEKVTRLIEAATKEKCPLVIVSASGGARMQEGIYSLMQMAKTAQALALHHQQGLLYISVLTHPTTGGVAASFATLGDINIAEKDALIGFAGPRVIMQTIRQELPTGFQTASFQQDHGMVDLVIERKHLKEVLIKCLRFHHGGMSFGK